MIDSKKTPQVLYFYVIYFNPSDYPEKWVVRKFTMTEASKNPMYVGDSLIEARKVLPHGRGVVNIGRSTNDDKVIHEVWV